MNVLLIALSFPPINNAQSIRWKYLSENLAKQGVNIEVTAPLVNPEIHLELNESILTRRIKPGKIISLFFKKKTKLKKNKLKYFLAKYLLYCAENLLLGEIFWQWPLKVKEFITKNIKISKYDAIIISVEPHIATALPALFVEHNNIILDIGDPPISNYFSQVPIFQNFHNFLFKKIIKKARGIVYTSWNSKTCLERQFDELRKKKSIVIHQGYDDTIYKNQRKIRKENRKIKIFYPGSFIKNIRNPSLLIDVLSKNPNVEFFFAGSTDPNTIFLFKKKLSERFHYIGNISHSKIRFLYPNFDALLYFGNNTIYQLSGKFFEFIPTNAVILQIFQSPKDETIKFSNNIYGIIPVFYDEFCLTQAIKYLEFSLSTQEKSKFFSHPMNFTNHRAEFFKEFSWYNLANKYHKFLEKLK